MPRRLLALVALLAWAATACRVDLVAGLDVERDGSGRVSAGVGLDDDAARELGDVSTAFRVDDLRASGWEVTGPRREGDGLTWIRAARSFSGPDEATVAMAQLSGPDGPLRDLRLTRTRSLLRSRTTFTGAVDLTAGLAGLADPELVQKLGDAGPGLDVESLRRRFGDDLDRAVRVEVTAGLPGDVETNAERRRGERALWSPALGQRLEMRASSEALKVPPALVTAAVTALLVPVSMVVVARRRRVRRLRQRQAGAG